MLHIDIITEAIKIPTQCQVNQPLEPIKNLTGYTTPIKSRAKRVDKFNTWSSVSSSRYSAGHISGLVDNPWPNLTKVGPSRVNVSLSSIARILLFWSSTPLFWSNKSFNPNKPTALRTWRALPTTYQEKGSNQITKTSHTHERYHQKDSNFGRNIRRKSEKPWWIGSHIWRPQAEGCTKLH